MKIGILAAGALALALALNSCASGPKEIPPDMDARELVQRAQEASDTYDYSLAVDYYRALADRYGADPAFRATADYEIAFIAYKQGRYAEAGAGFEDLLSRYSSPDAAGLPDRYKILAEKVLAVIKEKTGK